MYYPDYKENRMVEAAPGGHCSISSVMGIMNYFWYTSFTGKDYYEIMCIMKRGTFRDNQDDLLLVDEAGFMLAKLGFDIIIFYSGEKEKRIDYVYNPTIEKYKENLDPKYHQYIQGEYRVDPNDWNSVADGKRCKLTDTRTEKEMLENNGKLINISWGANIINDIIDNQGEGVLFLVGLDTYILQEIEKQEDRPSGGHVVVVKQIIDGKVQIFDPGPALGNGYRKPIDVFLKAVSDGGGYDFVKVTEK